MVLTGAWAVFAGVGSYQYLSQLYALTPAQESYHFTLPDGRAVVVFAPTQEGAVLRALQEKDFAKSNAIAAPTCRGGGRTCDIDQRDWDSGDRWPVSDTKINDAGEIEGPYIIIDRTAFAKAWSKLKATAVADGMAFFLPPVALAVLFLGLGWVIRGFWPR